MSLISRKSHRDPTSTQKLKELFRKLESLLNENSQRETESSSDPLSKLYEDVVAFKESFPQF